MVAASSGNPLAPGRTTFLLVIVPTRCRARLFIQTECLTKLIELSGCQISPLSLWNTLQYQRSQANTLQSQDRVSDPFHHAAHDPVATFVDRNSQHGPVRLVAYRADRAWANLRTVNRHAVRQFIEHRPRRVPIQ